MKAFGATKNLIFSHTGNWFDTLEEQTVLFVPELARMDALLRLFRHGLHPMG
jgi:hypothetical protein